MDTDSNLLGHVLLPVANPDDASKTARALAEYDPAQVTALHVVEKGGGAPDKTPVEHSRKVAEECFDTVSEVFPDANTETAYSESIIDGIFDTSEAVDATAIVYRSRGGGRLLHFLSGDLTLKLATRSPIPVIALPLEAEN